ncbi:hypothetical protein AB4225_34210 [Streptomyces sp. 2RAF24]|uniref:hypothetical protein n=1 Tax=Streptomyces sp. 2RAF24 TaxID=3232997 RepID=UPI003F99BD52
MIEVIIAAVAGVLGAALGSWATTRSARTAQGAALEAARTAERATMQAAWIAKEVKEAQVEIVDASFVEFRDLDEEERASVIDSLSFRPGRKEAILDIKLRNTGDETAYVHEIQLTAEDVRDGFEMLLPEVDQAPLWPPGRGVSQNDTRGTEGVPSYGEFPRRALPSHAYRSRRRNGSNKEQFRRVSQVVARGEVDRFLVVVEVPGDFFKGALKILFRRHLIW